LDKTLNKLSNTFTVNILKMSIDNTFLMRKNNHNEGLRRRLLRQHKLRFPNADMLIRLRAVMIKG